MLLGGGCFLLPGSCLAQSGATRDLWIENGFANTSAPLPLSGVEQFTSPEVGSNSDWISRPSSILFPGTEFGPPSDLPFGFVLDDLLRMVEDRKAAEGFAMNATQLALELSPAKPQEGMLLGRLNLKEKVYSSNPLRGALEDGINFFYGIGTRVSGVSSKTADYLAGGLSLGTYLSRSKVMPYGGIFSDDHGDDPKGATHSRLGQEYYDSGQYMYDFFYFSYTRYGTPVRTRFDDYYKYRRKEWEEANARLKLRANVVGGSLGDEIRGEIRKTERQREALESALKKRNAGESDWHNHQIQIYMENLSKIQAEAAEREVKRREELALERKRQAEEAARIEAEKREMAIRQVEEMRQAMLREQALQREREERMKQEDRDREATARQRQKDAELADAQRQQNQQRNWPPSSSGGGGGSTTPTGPPPVIVPTKP